MVNRKKETKKEIARQLKVMQNRPYTICVDLDGVLAECQREWKGNMNIGKPIENNIYILALRHVLNPDMRILIHTARVTSFDEKKILPESVENIEEWLDSHGVPFTEVWIGPGKPSAQEYWDDRAVKFVPVFEKE